MESQTARAYMHKIECMERLGLDWAKFDFMLNAQIVGADYM